MFAGIFSCTPSFSPEINKVYLILSYYTLHRPIIKYITLLPERFKSSGMTLQYEMYDSRQRVNRVFTLIHEQLI